MVKNTFDQMDRELKFERTQLIFSIVLFGKCTRWPCLLFFCPGFYRPRYGGQTGEKLPFPPFLQERGGKSQNRKRGMGMGGGQKNKNREEWRSV